MYKDEYSEEITKKLSKIKRKDPRHFDLVRRKMDWILENPKQNFKFLHYTMKGLNRIHISHFVLVFRIDNESETVYFEDYDHHDQIYH